MSQIKLFQHDDISKLENDVNEFLDTIHDDSLVDVKYQIEHKALSTDTETGVYPSASHTVIIVYK